MLIEERQIYSGRVIRLNVEKVKLPNGVTCELEMIHHPGGVAIVAMNEQQEICLVHQFRHAAGGWLWELPAGKIEKDEAPALTAKRELIEEVGVEASTWFHLGKTISSPGVFTEMMQLYLAKDLQHCEQKLEDEEVLEVHWFPIKKIMSMIQAGEIYDAKTLVGLFFLQQHM